MRFEIPALSADVATHRGEVARAQARIENARAAQTRAHDLFDRGIAARKEVEDADRELADARGRPDRGGAPRLAPSKPLPPRPPSAPASTAWWRSGTTIPATWSKPTSSDPVLRVVDPQAPRSHGFRSRFPMSPRSRDWAPRHVSRNPSGEGEIDLKVVSRPAAVDPGPPRCRFDSRLLPPPSPPVGTPVQITIDAEQHRNVVLVPAAAVIHEGEETAVFVANGDKAERRVVTLGMVDGEHAEIRAASRPASRSS